MAVPRGDTAQPPEEELFLWLETVQGPGCSLSPRAFQSPSYNERGALMTGALDDLLRPFELFNQHL